MAENRKQKKCIVEILPGIFLGNKYSSSNHDLLKSLQIKHIVNVGGGKNAFEDDGIRYHKIVIADRSDVSILPYLEEACDYVHNSLTNGHVLIHCRGGFSRSPTALIAYLIKYHEMSFAEGLALVKSKRSCVQPNATFIDDLKCFEKCLRTEQLS